MKRFIIIAMLTAIMPLAAMAQHEEDTENGVVSLAGRRIHYRNQERRFCIQTLFARTDQCKPQLVRR